MDRPLVTAMAGMTISCPRPEQLIGLLSGPVGWELYAEGDIDPVLESIWGIAPGSAGKRFAILRSPGSERGMIRVVEGTERERTRPMGTRWTGVEIVVMEDLDGLHRALDVLPEFSTIKAPADADFTDVGANIHRFFHGKAPGGTHLMFTMGVTAPRDYSFPSASSRVGYIFDIPLVTDRFADSMHFYHDILGMEPILEDNFREGIWHEAWKLPAGALVELAILKGDAPDFGLGGIELQGYDAQFIDPIPADPIRLDGGACLATYTAKNLDVVFRVVSNADSAKVLSEPIACDLAPYHGKRAFTFAGPSGERMEICERDWD